MTSSTSVLAVCLNATFVHTSASVRILRNMARDRLGLSALALEFSLGEPAWKMAESILVHEPRVVGFSIYIWNREASLALISRLRRMAPDLLIVVGGPEVWFESSLPPDVDVLVRGEGEELWLQLLQRFFAGERVSGTILGDADANEVLPPRLDTYRAEDAGKLRGRLAYLETSRGCPFRCAFCLSGRAACRLRFASESEGERLLEVVLWLREQGVRTIKFLDRTFNANPARALALWNVLAPVSGMGFHFEVEAALLDGPALAFLASVPPGRFQFEIGVQSTRPETLRSIGRREDVESVLERLTELAVSGRIHVHADLIWGLPGDDMASIIDGFNRLFATGVHELQLGFLKLLPGAPLGQTVRSSAYRFDPRPPYEVLVSDALSASELRALHCLEQVFNLYSNSKRFVRSLRYLLEVEGSQPFALFSLIADHFRSRGYWAVSLGVEQQIDILLELFPAAELLADYLLLDYVCSQNVFTIPKRLKNPMEISRELKARFKASAQLQLVSFFHRLDCETMRFTPAANPGIYLVERRGDEVYSLAGASVTRVG
jgi:hypothetical protein